MAIRLLLTACLASAVLVACSDERPDALPQAPESMQDAAPAPGPTAEAPAGETAGAGLVSAEPAGFCAAERRQQATIAWDVRPTGAKRVTVHTGESPDSKVFFRGGASGEKETGAWVRPGMVFVVRNADNGEELGRVRIESRDC